MKKRGRRGPRRMKEDEGSFALGIKANSSTRFRPPPPHLRPMLPLRSNESIRRFHLFPRLEPPFPRTSFREVLPPIYPPIGPSSDAGEPPQFPITLSLPVFNSSGDAKSRKIFSLLSASRSVDRLLVHLAATTTELTAGRDALVRQLITFVLIVSLDWR